METPLLQPSPRSANARVPSPSENRELQEMGPPQSLQRSRQTKSQPPVAGARAGYPPKQLSHPPHRPSDIATSPSLQSAGAPPQSLPPENRPSAAASSSTSPPLPPKRKPLESRPIRQFHPPIHTDQNKRRGLISSYKRHMSHLQLLSRRRHSGGSLRRRHRLPSKLSPRTTAREGDHRHPGKQEHFQP